MITPLPVPISPCVRGEDVAVDLVDAVAGWRGSRCGLLSTVSKHGVTLRPTVSKYWITLVLHSSQLSRRRSRQEKLPSYLICAVNRTVSEYRITWWLLAAVFVKHGVTILPGHRHPGQAGEEQDGRCVCQHHSHNHSWT